MVNDFKETYQKEFNEVITEEQANEYESKLASFFELLIKIDKREKIVKKS